MPTAFSIGAGVLIALALGCATVVSVTWVDKSQTSERHLKALQMFGEMSNESRLLLAYLVDHPSEARCDSAGLTVLNSHLLRSRYIREIGLLDADSRLICSSSLGRLSQAIKGDHPVVHLRSGLEVLNGVPLQTADGLKAVIVQRRPYNVVLSPFATNDLYSSADVVWARTTAGLVLLHSSRPETVIPVMRARAAVAETTIKFSTLGYELTSLTPDSDIVLQTRRGSGVIARDSGPLFPGLLAASLLIAVLSVGILRPVILRLSRLHNRIGYLCDDQHLVLSYQPVFDLISGRPIGCEVLTSLKENGKLWRPDDIIPALMQSGLTGEFDRAVTRKAIRELAIHLPAQNAPFSVALNYFPETIQHTSLIPTLNQALEDAGRNDFTICVEVTEHSLSSELITEVRSLKGHGFFVAIDDFGTGYSNLKSITRLAPDLLKIDRSFVYDIAGATMRSNLIPEIVSIARAVNASVVAEGIEREEQIDLLVAAGIRYGQGYALGYPMQMAQFVAFMQRNQGAGQQV